MRQARRFPYKGALWVLGLSVLLALFLLWFLTQGTVTAPFVYQVF